MRFVLVVRLSGRLELLVSQIKQNTDQDIVEDGDLLVYEDKGICIQIAITNEKTISNWHLNFVIQIHQIRMRYCKMRNRLMISGKKRARKRWKLATTEKKTVTRIFSD